MLKTVPLGQELFRTACEEQSLMVFGQAHEAMYDTRLPLAYRHDVFAAGRFALAGLVLDVWQDKITKPADPFVIGIGSTVVRHGFEDDFFPVHNPTLIDTRLSPLHKPRLEITQGRHALDTMRDGLRNSMNYVIDNSEGLTTHAIHADDIIDTLDIFMRDAHRLGFTHLPDHYDYGDEAIEDLYLMSNDTTPDIRGALVEPARNPIRFLARPLDELMYSCANTKLVREVDSIAFKVATTQPYDLDDIGQSIDDLTRHAIRASQRNDKNRTVIDNTSILGSRRISATPTEVTWDGKHQRPARQLNPYEPIPQDDLFSNRHRQKCPIGYTPDAFQAMPLRKIYDGIIRYLAVSGVAEPEMYVAPKELGTSLSHVR